MAHKLAINQKDFSSNEFNTRIIKPLIPLISLTKQNRQYTNPSCEDFKKPLVFLVSNNKKEKKLHLIATTSADKLKEIKKKQIPKGHEELLIEDLNKFRKEIEEKFLNSIPNKVYKFPRLNKDIIEENEPADFTHLLIKANTSTPIYLKKRYKTLAQDDV